MIKILVHLHLYYTEMWPEMEAHLKNIVADYDLFVTLTKEDETLKQKIQAFKSDAVVSAMENRGFDVAPFIDILNHVNLDDYDYIIKLHTKRDMPKGFSLQKYDMSYGKHRSYLMNFINSSDNLKKCLNAFKRDKNLGMIGDFRIICKKDRKGKDVVKKGRELLVKAGFADTEAPFILGTMFFARSELFKAVGKLNLTFDDFIESVRGKDILPYGLEAFFGFMVGAQGMKIKAPLHSKAYQIGCRLCSAIGRVLYRKKVDYDGKTIVKICKIPVFVSKNKGGQNAL